MNIQEWLNRTLIEAVVPYEGQTIVLSDRPGTLCSRNFQNVKLSLDFVEIDLFIATQILHEIKFWRVQAVQKCHF